MRIRYKYNVANLRKEEECPVLNKLEEKGPIPARHTYFVWVADGGHLQKFVHH